MGAFTDLIGSSLDPAPDTSGEAAFAAVDVRGALEWILGPGGPGWSFRVLNGDVSSALARLAESTGASMFVVGGGRPGLGLRVSRLLEGAVSARLIRVSEPPGRRGA